jgi:SulP family sulfate permease
MVENVPFTNELARKVIQIQGYGIDALSTLFVLFGIASLLVGAIFYLLGRCELGRVVYYFPTFVLVGCIGGIGLYITKTGIEVAMNAAFSVVAIWKNFHLLTVVVMFEVALRILQRLTRKPDGKPRYSLLSPIYFCLITPVFYSFLWLLRVDIQDAVNAGYFFPSLDDCDTSGQDCGSSNTILDGHTFDMWRAIDFSVVSWTAILSSIPTLVSLILFSLIHVPINIPAFAISTNTEADMNRELVAHGVSNFFAGLLGGLQNYMAYTQSVLYHKSGGSGMASGMAVAALTTLLFFIGPTIASYIPRCMAGTLLVHVGSDLFLEGTYDSYDKFDSLEYFSIWLIAIVMIILGMDAAMVTGVITAVFVFIMQNMTYVDPVRGSMMASTLRSSQYNRGHKAQAILDDPQIGRDRILVVQLQSHLFFGNMAHLTKTISRLLSENVDSRLHPLIVILDFSLVLGIDSSAAQAMTKLKSSMQSQYNVELSIFVSGSSDGFPCQFDLSKELKAPSIPTSLYSSIDEEIATESTALTKLHRVSSHDAMESMTFSGSHVSTTLDEALIFAENYLIHKQDASLLDDIIRRNDLVLRQNSSMSEEKDTALQYLKNLCPGTVSDKDARKLFSMFEREIFYKGAVLWKQGSESDCVKLLVRGKLIATLENEAGTQEIIDCGNTLGELGLIEGVPRMSSVRCLSEEAILYTMGRNSFSQLSLSSPHAARLLDLICIRYLSARVQHVSNRIFETRCLPV